ncbi:protein FdrA [Terrabacter sp. MAHUQ-38]|uniref:protein FdrA n=1 Tax=unclassified Terrabacter TaxID=2630222 RepID=UPI00165DEC2B|nr:protein FdrA [Terrabacter sp. MAHUQ-38]MBC9822898.1 protein FdrA [Terrabacter sp. MAHUQ-38]
MTGDVRIFYDTYVDSVMQLKATRAMTDIVGVEWAAAAMATPANQQTLTSEGFATTGMGSANDLFLAVRGADDAVVQGALSAGADIMFASRHSKDGTVHTRAHRTIGRAARERPDTNVAIISVPGAYAALEAHEALTAGLDVLLFSDNVSVSDEVALKERAAGLGHLLMGPGAGTALLGGTGLGFANVVDPGPVGIMAAAGTGAQEAMSLLDRWGVGISCVIGLGGRDLSEAVDGQMAKAAIASLRADPGTELIFLVSKPPAERVARAVLATADDFPLIAALVGRAADAGPITGRRVARTLEAGALEVLDLLGVERPDILGALQEQVAGACEGLAAGRTLVRGLFSGGTLCYESLVILGDVLGPVYSNVPLDDSLRAPAPPGSHICLDLGEEEYTVGRPHPMIDLQARVEMVDEQGRDPAVAVILLDVVLGFGAHQDPASQLAPACARAVQHGASVVAYVLGTHQDPQGYVRQRAMLKDAGCIVPETAARAAYAAAAIARRDPSLVTRQP